MHHSCCPLYVSIVDDLQVWSFGSIVPPPRRSAALQLLAFLLLHREVDRHPRDHVAEVLWPDVQKQSALACLRQALHELQRALPAHPDGRAWIDTCAGYISWSDLGSSHSSVDAWELSDGERSSDTHPARCTTGIYYLDYVAITDRISGELFPCLEDEWSIPFQLQVESACLSIAARFLQRLTTVGEEYRATLERVRLQARLRSAVDIDGEGELAKLSMDDELDNLAGAAEKHNANTLQDLVRLDRDSSCDMWIELLERAQCQRLVTWRRTTPQTFVHDLRSEVARPLAESGLFAGATSSAISRGQTGAIPDCPGGSSLLQELDGLADCISRMIQASAEDEMLSLPARVSGHMKALSSRSIIVLLDSICGLEFNAAAACAHVLNASDLIRVICCSQIELGLAGEAVVCEADWPDGPHSLTLTCLPKMVQSE